MTEIIKSIKNKNYITFIVLLVVFIVGVSNDGMGFYRNYIKEKRAEDGLEKINTGVSIQYIKSIFGVPIVENHDDNLTEYVYSFKKFYLQIIYDKDNTVQFYAVTTKDKDFKPYVPYLDFELGTKTYSEIAPSDFDFLYSNLSSKYFEYAESYYMANFGNYRTIYLAYNPAGVLDSYKNEEPFFNASSQEYKENEAKIKKLRKWLIPNTYAVGNILGDETNILNSYTIGVDYFLSRDLPQINY